MKVLLKILLVVFVSTVLLFFFHFNSLKNVNSATVEYYSRLKESLKKKGYQTKIVVISSNRIKLENLIFQKVSVASKQSQHLNGGAIDFIVVDVNDDGIINGKDVDIVYKILDNEIIKDSGGIGTYKKQGLLKRQMVHIDCREEMVRWNY